MHKTNNHHDKPPYLPPLSVSLTRPDAKPSLPQPEPQSLPKPDSPLRLESPHPSETDSALVPSSEKFYSPLNSPLPPTPPSPLPPLPHHVINFNRRDEIPRTQSGVVNGGGDVKERGVRLGFRGRKEDVVVKLGFGIRVLEIVLCLISFSVMASDKTEGWSGDSFDRYNEYRFCLTVAIFGFVYAGFQAFALGTYLSTGKRVITHRLRYQFDFLMDQIIAYLLISASSAAASRVDDWQTNWGKDEFTEKASASISMAFLAFFCFAGSSLISGYNLCNRDLH